MRLSFIHFVRSFPFEKQLQSLTNFLLLIGCTWGRLTQFPRACHIIYSRSELRRRACGCSSFISNRAFVFARNLPNFIHISGIICYKLMIDLLSSIFRWRARGVGKFVNYWGDVALYHTWPLAKVDRATKFGSCSLSFHNLQSVTPF